MPDGQYKLDASDYLAGDFFAQCVAIDGDTVVVGAGNSDPDSNDIYIYQWSGSQWLKLKSMCLITGRMGRLPGH